MAPKPKPPSDVQEAELHLRGFFHAGRLAQTAYNRLLKLLAKARRNFFNNDRDDDSPTPPTKPPSQRRPQPPTPEGD